MSRGHPHDLFAGSLTKAPPFGLIQGGPPLVMSWDITPLIGVSTYPNHFRPFIGVIEGYNGDNGYNSFYN